MTALRSVRYAVVGLGHIAQVAVLPAFAHAARNSQLAALVSGDPAKRLALGDQYRVDSTYGYEDYDECLRHVDAVYLALPNALHLDYARRAAHAHVHVLCEKPLAVTVADCIQMIETCREHRVKLMVAYRLYFEDASREVLTLVQNGRIGDLKYFQSAFSIRVRPGDIRTRGLSEGGGTLFDLGVYCINAARRLFGGEPLEASACAVKGGEAHLSQIGESTACILKFDGGRVASFVTSFNAIGHGSYQIVGTSGHIRVDPGYTYSDGLAYELTADGHTIRKPFPRQDQFAAELLHFSDCILDDREPESPASDGLEDVRIVQALHQSVETGRAVAISRLRA